MNMGPETPNREREASPQELAAAISLRVERILPPDLDAHSTVAVRRFLNLCLCGLALEASSADLPAAEDANAVAAAAARAVGFGEQLPEVDLKDGGIAMGLAVTQKDSVFHKLQMELQDRIRENERMDTVFALLCARE